MSLMASFGQSDFRAMILPWDQSKNAQNSGTLFCVGVVGSIMASPESGKRSRAVLKSNVYQPIAFARSVSHWLIWIITSSQPSSVSRLCCRAFQNSIERSALEA